MEKGMTREMDRYCDKIHHDCQHCDYEGNCQREFDYIEICNQDAQEAAERRKNKIYELLSDFADLARQINEAD